MAFAGLPGTGKSTLARAVADGLGATFVRIDTIEAALRRSGRDPGAQGYEIGNCVPKNS